jgi:hypothetical protein
MVTLDTLNEPFPDSTDPGKDVRGALGPGEATGRLVHLCTDEADEESLAVHAAVHLLPECDQGGDIEVTLLLEEPGEIDPFEAL